MCRFSLTSTCDLLLVRKRQRSLWGGITTSAVFFRKWQVKCFNRKDLVPKVITSHRWSVDHSVTPGGSGMSSHGTLLYRQAQKQCYSKRQEAPVYCAALLQICPRIRFSKIKNLWSIWHCYSYFKVQIYLLLPSERKRFSSIYPFYSIYLGITWLTRAYWQ